MTRVKDDFALIGPAELAVLLGISVRTISRLKQQGLLPKPVNCGSRLVRWRVADVQSFMASQS